jgi:DNA-binding PucR family transcriptional regulator
MAKDEITPIRCKIILALADNRMRVTEAARELFMHYSTVIYHIRLIKAITGKDPMNFYDLIDLVRMAREMLTDVYY